MSRRPSATESGLDYSGLTPLADHKNLAETVYQHLLGALTDLKIRPGETLNEVRLAQHLGVSVTPVREALLRLSADGLVIREPQRQPRVVMLTPPEVKELYDVRGALESFAAAEAAANATDEDLRRLDPFIEQSAHFAEDAMSEAYDAYHDGVHRTILALAENQLLEKMMQAIWVKIRLCMSVTATIPGQRRLGAREHTAIIELIKARKAGDAADAMRRHCDIAKRSYLENYAKQEESHERAQTPTEQRRATVQGSLS